MVVLIPRSQKCWKSDEITLISFTSMQVQLLYSFGLSLISEWSQSGFDMSAHSKTKILILYKESHSILGITFSVYCLDKQKKIPMRDLRVGNNMAFPWFFHFATPQGAIFLLSLFQYYRLPAMRKFLIREFLYVLNFCRCWNWLK